MLFCNPHFPDLLHRMVAKSVRCVLRPESKYVVYTSHSKLRTRLHSSFEHEFPRVLESANHKQQTVHSVFYYYKHAKSGKIYRMIAMDVELPYSQNVVVYEQLEDTRLRGTNTTLEKGTKWQQNQVDFFNKFKAI